MGLEFNECTYTGSYQLMPNMLNEKGTIIINGGDLKPIEYITKFQHFPDSAVIFRRVKIPRYMRSIPDIFFKMHGIKNIFR